MKTLEPSPSIAVSALREFTGGFLRALDVSAEDAETTAEALVMTDAWGVFTHGTKLLAGYARRLRAGGLSVTGRPGITREGPGWAIVDGQSSLGQVTSVFAMQQAIQKARQRGIAYVGVQNSCHFGAAGYYAWLAAREGLVGLAMANDVPSVAAPGSRGAILGSNPIAYAIPARRHSPLLLDMSIATVAGGKVYARCKRGEPIPAGWLVGPDGRPTQDGSLYPQQASLAPFAGHKGYGLGLLIESLSAVASGAAVTSQVGSWLFDDPSQPTRHGAAFVAIDVAAITGDEASFPARIDALVDEIHRAPTADDGDRVLVPGEIEWRNYHQAQRSGIPLPVDVWSTLHDLAGEYGQRLDVR